MLSKDSPGVAYNLFKDQYESKSLVVDLSTIIRSFGPRYKDRTDVTFEDFISVIIDHILQMTTNMWVKRLDLIADLYEPMSIKGPTRKDRGSETAPRTVFESTSFLPRDMNTFLNNSENKTELNEMIAKQIVHPLKCQGINVIVSIFKR